LEALWRSEWGRGRQAFRCQGTKKKIRVPSFSIGWRIVLGPEWASKAEGKNRPTRVVSGSRGCRRKRKSFFIEKMVVVNTRSFRLAHFQQTQVKKLFANRDAKRQDGKDTQSLKVKRLREVQKKAKTNGSKHGQDRAAWRSKFRAVNRVEGVDNQALAGNRMRTTKKKERPCSQRLEENPTIRRLF